MWVLVVVTLVSGGTMPPKIQEATYTTRDQCIAAKKQREVPASVFGYCEYRNSLKK
jgi:hypothetical protein